MLNLTPMGTVPVRLYANLPEQYQSKIQNPKSKIRRIPSAPRRIGDRGAGCVVFAGYFNGNYHKENRCSFFYHNRKR